MPAWQKSESGDGTHGLVVRCRAQWRRLGLAELRRPELLLPGVKNVRVGFEESERCCPEALSRNWEGWAQAGGGEGRGSGRGVGAGVGAGVGKPYHARKPGRMTLVAKVCSHGHGHHRHSWSEIKCKGNHTCGVLPAGFGTNPSERRV